MPLFLLSDFCSLRFVGVLQLVVVVVSVAAAVARCSLLHRQQQRQLHSTAAAATAALRCTVELKLERRELPAIFILLQFLCDFLAGLFKLFAVARKLQKQKSENRISFLFDLFTRFSQSRARVLHAICVRLFCASRVCKTYIYFGLN